MNNNRYSKYRRLYENKFESCEFLMEQNFTIEKMIEPLDEFINEEFLKSLVGAANNFGTWLSGVWASISKFFGKFTWTNFKAAVNKRLEKSERFNKIKKSLSGLRGYILKNDLCDENNKPKWDNIWKALIRALSGTDVGKDVNPNDLVTIGSKFGSKFNESKYNISDEEVKYYGVFEKIAHAMGIKNARFNGVVSQIMKKGTFGMAIIGLMKVAGFTLTGIGAAMAGLNPITLAAIGGMLLMAGLIILAIWICKPYPTLEDCLGYLKLAFSDKLEEREMTNMFTIINITDVDITISGGGSGGSGSGDTGVDSSQAEKDAQSKQKSSTGNYGLMIRNLTALMEMIRVHKDVYFEGERVPGKMNLEVGKIYTYTNKVGKKKKVKIISMTRSADSAGPDKEWLTKDDKLGAKLYSDDVVSVISKDKEGKFSHLSPKFAVYRNQLKESRIFVDFEDFVYEANFGDSENMMVGKEDKYLTQSLENIRKSMKVLLDEKDKGVGITFDFVKGILDKKMDEGAKDVIKKLYEDIYFYVEGPGAKTISDLGPLYKESLEVISNLSKRKVTAEKIARLYKRTSQFEGEGFYGGLGKFGMEMKTFNESMKELMERMKS